MFMISTLKALVLMSLTSFLFVPVAFSADLQSHVITMKSISFDPKAIVIKKGESVEWVNKSYTEHSATADDGSSFDTALIAPQKKSKAVQLNKTGTYPYHCSVHGKTMHAQIVVEE